MSSNRPDEIRKTSNFIVFSLFVGLLFLTLVDLHAGQPGKHQILISSVPSGALVCKKSLRHEECYGTTPVSVELEFNDVNESKKILLKKIGYKAAEHIVDIDSRKISITMDRQNILFAPDRHQDKKLKQLQRQVNARIQDVIYSPGKLIEPNFEFINQIKVNESDSRIYLSVSILVNSSESLKEIKKAGRERQDQRKLYLTIEAFNKNEIFDLFDSIASSLVSLSLDKIEFNILFSKSKAVLDFKQVEEITQQYTGSYYTTTGGTTQRVDTYALYSSKRDVTIVNDNKTLVNYILLEDFNLVKAGKWDGIYFNIDKIAIFTNDNRKDQLKEIQYIKLE
jgi:hypothetical protein